MADDGGMDDQRQSPNPFSGGRWDPPPVESASAIPGRHVDRGTRSTAILAWIALTVLVVTTFTLQQISAATAKPVAPSTGIAPPRTDDSEAMTLKLLVKMGHFLDQLSPQSASSGPGGANPLVANADASAHRPESRLRAAIVAGEIGGANEAEPRLIALKEELEDTSSERSWSDLPEEDRRVLTEDTKALLEFYGAGTPLTPSAQADLITRHGYFGKLALVYGTPDTDPVRAELLSGGGKLITLLGGFGALVLLVILGGLAAFIIMSVLLFSGRLKSRFVPPIPGGSVYLETVAMFFLGFLLVHASINLVVSNQWVTEANALYVAMGAQWCLLPLIFWPVVRGTPFSRWRRDMGLHAGEGFFAELGSGLAGYLAGIPLLLIAMAISIVAVLVKQGLSGPGDAPPVENPVVDLVARGGIAPWLLFALGTIWAPLVEESIFRGAMYRHLRGVLGVLLSSILVAVAFGSAHGYEWMMLGPVIALGFNFSLMRQWRGSLIGPIAAHCLHNATVLLMVITLFTLLKD